MPFRKKHYLRYLLYTSVLFVGLLGLGLFEYYEEEKKIKFY